MNKLISSIILVITGLMITTEISAQSWTEQNVNFQIPGSDPFKVSIVDANVAWTIGDYNVISQPDQEFSRTTDGGQTWTAGIIESNPDYASMSIAAIDATHAFVAQINQVTNSGGYIYYTADGGVTWTQSGAGQIFDHAPNSFVVGIYFWDASEGITFGDAVNNKFEIYLTHDGGGTWVQVPGSDIPNAMTSEWIIPKSYCIVDSTIWIGTAKGRVFRSTDRGQHWSVTQVGTNGNTIPAFLSDKMTGLANNFVNGTAVHYRTTDGGITWTQYSPAGPAYALLAGIPGTNYFVSADCTSQKGSSYSLDNGDTWYAIDTAGNGTTDGYFWLSFLDLNTGYASGFVSSSGTGGISKWNPEILGIKEPQASADISIFPNPASDLITVNGIKNDKEKEFRIFDSFGRLITKGILTTAHSTIDISSYSPGIYFLETGNVKLKIMKI